MLGKFDSWLFLNITTFLISILTKWFYWSTEEVTLFNLYSKFDYPTAIRWWLALVLICCAVTSIHAQETIEKKSVVENKFTGT